MPEREKDDPTGYYPALPREGDAMDRDALARAEILLDSAEAFVHEVLEQYPQVDQKGKLNYYFCGSLAFMLLSRAKKFEVLDTSCLPEIVPNNVGIIPPEAAQFFKRLARQIGDLDFVPLEEWRRSDTRMKKGGGGPSMASLSERAKNILKDADKQSMVMCDPIGGSVHKVACIELGGQGVYIQDPEMMLPTKAAHTAISFDHGKKTSRLVRDFSAMLHGMQTMYPREELLRSAHREIVPHKSPNAIFIPYYNPECTAELKQFYDAVLALDPDAPYLHQLQYGKERSAGILTVLHQYQSAEAKQAIIDFFNTHREHIDRWSINYHSLRNREAVADFILDHPDLHEGFKKSFSGELTKKSIIEYMETKHWVMDAYGDTLPLEMCPKRSQTMDTLMSMNEEHIGRELYDVGELLECGTDEDDLERILCEKLIADPETRRRVLLGIKTARATLHDRFKEFMPRLRLTVSDSGYFTKGSYVNYTKQQMLERMASVFTDVGLEF